LTTPQKPRTPPRAPRPPDRPSVFEFVDHRAYLKAYYEAEKARRPAFSYRYFARRAGQSSPNFLKLVIEGKRNLGKESVPAFAKALDLDAEEASFFGDLVAFNQAATTEEKNRHFVRIAASRNFRKARRIEGELFEYLSHWYIPAVRELAARPDFRDEAKWIAAQLRPTVAVRDAAHAMKVLLSLGLLVKREDGHVERGEPSWTTGHEVTSFAVVNYHQEMLRRASDAIESVAQAERNVSSLVVCVSPATIPEIKRRMQALHEELLALCDADKSPEIVYQIGMQCFPLSQGGK
jgi:uncharacterized protein (TIGR02147 family)